MFMFANANENDGEIGAFEMRKRVVGVERVAAGGGRLAAPTCADALSMRTLALVTC